ncbi:hypothetical protein [Actinokineospora iranica]|uniref:Secreted protein n=1 Tax=Actinokineospora iranica TaxID=1271860 RepID=A0A1G6WB39_9PSEU|nr:hypothetical protein [Actinokineospora iranica]SDD62447.1 hypothetical protein SAMN05216174_11476 [Actinokineospora iranica]
MKTTATAVLTAALALTGIGLCHADPSGSGRLEFNSTSTQVELTGSDRNVPASGACAKTLDWPWI